MNHKTFITISLVLLIFGCSNDDKETEISAYATAVRKSDGTVEVRDTTKNEMKQLDASIKKHEEIDQKFPSPWNIQEIAKLEIYKIKSISNQGAITLEDNTTLVIEGVKCSSKGLSYIPKLLASDTDRIAFIPSTDSQIKPTPAFIWHADLSLMQDPELKGFITGPSYSMLNETVITSGWCLAEQTENNKLYERYRALEELGKNRLK